jgi:hypothetical protein
LTRLIGKAPTWCPVFLGCADSFALHAWSDMVTHHGSSGAILASAVLFISACTRASIAPRADAEPLHARDAEAARRDVITFGAFRIEQMDISDARAGENSFRALVTNTSDVPAVLGVELRAIAGQWSPQGAQRALSFALSPGEQRQIESRYTLRRFTTEAAVRVSFGRPVLEGERVSRIDDLFFRRWYAVGAGNPAASDLSAGLIEKRTAHLTLLAQSGSPAARDLESIAATRESAVKSVLTGPDGI